MIYLSVALLLLAGCGFIFGLKMLGRPETARRGNLVSAGGMTFAVIGTLLYVIHERGSQFDPVSLAWIGGGLVIGTIVGIPAARLVKMTAMPEMVALFNGFGGIASLFIGWAQVQAAVRTYAQRSGEFEGLVSFRQVLGELGGGDGGFVAVTVCLAILIGGVTFTGSLVAFGKLSERITSKPVLYPGQQIVNVVALLATLGATVLMAVRPELHWLIYVVMPISLGLGVAFVIPIGGGDMPVVISLLNSYSGLAACAAGFAIGDELLIITGALVGASGIILTRIMCLAMNRSLMNVLFSGFGSTSTTGGGGGSGEKQEATILTPDQAYYVLEAASSVIFVPGYGMAVAQAQHTVKELAKLLEANGCEVRYAIHPVAGRMPGHMNVLLAEADVPYDSLVGLEDVNPTMETVDVAIVIGANDVVNPAALTDESSPIYGMPIVEVQRARQVFTLKRSLGSGYAGIDNPLFYLDNNAMVLGDAKKTIQALIDAFKTD